MGVAAIGGRLLSGPVARDQFFAQVPRGAYTAVRSPALSNLLDWTLHERRLLQSMRVLHEGGAVQYHGCFGGADSLTRDALHDALVGGVAPVLDALEASAGSQPAMLIVVVSPREVSAAPESPSSRLTVACYGAVMERDPFCSQAPGAGLIAGCVRHLPSAKDSAWVHDRAELEALGRKAGAADVILQDDKGRLVEGLVTNLFVVRRA